MKSRARPTAALPAIGASQVGGASRLAPQQFTTRAAVATLAAILALSCAAWLASRVIAAEKSIPSSTGTELAPAHRDLFNAPPQSFDAITALARGMNAAGLDVLAALATRGVTWNGRKAIL